MTSVSNRFDRRAQLVYDQKNSPGVAPFSSDSISLMGVQGVAPGGLATQRPSRPRQRRCLQWCRDRLRSVQNRLPRRKRGLIWAFVTLLFKAGPALDTPAPSAVEPWPTVEDVLLLLAFLYHAFRGGASNPPGGIGGLFCLLVGRIFIPGRPIAIGDLSDSLSLGLRPSLA